MTQIRKNRFSEYVGDGGDRLGYLLAKVRTFSFYPSNSLYGVANMAITMLSSAVTPLNTNAHRGIQIGKFSFLVCQLLCHRFVSQFHAVA